MKTLIVSCPIRPTPAGFPPLGSLSVMNYVRKRGFPDTSFYDIDGLRPAYDDVLARIRAERPDVLGISAVVSTAYAFAKKLSLDVKAMLPDTTIVLGGNLAASAEILLRQTGVDFCVIGEGEETFRKFLERATTTREPDAFADVPGLAYLSADGALKLTGFEIQLASPLIYDVDWADLAASSNIDHYIYPAFDVSKGLVWSSGAHDPRSYEPKRRNKRAATLAVGKGCVARCTFCHRFDKGIRHVPVDVLMTRLEELIERYDVGFVDMHIESFGADRRWLTEFCEKVARYDILWRANGVRSRSVSPEIIDMCKQAGCTWLVYGFESGSQRMLDVMEKKTPLQSNYDAAQWTLDAGLYTVAQFVLGMPGESNDTVTESIQFARHIYTRVPWLSPSDCSVNYAQALPGTPLYEYGRRSGRIGSSLLDEEGYLLRISDSNAADTDVTVNHTDAATLDWYSWRPRVINAVAWAYIRKYGLDAYIRVLNGDEPLPGKGGQAWVAMRRAAPLSPAELRRLKLRFLLTGLPRIVVSATPLLRVLMALRPALIDEGRRRGRALGAWAVPGALGLLGRWVGWHLRHLGRKLWDYQSLRKVLQERFPEPNGDDPAMRALRDGR